MLEAALWAFHHGRSFRDGALLAVNLGEDADTTGAIYASSLAHSTGNRVSRRSGAGRAARLVISAVNHRRIRRARAWLEARKPAEEILILGASLDASNELARGVAREKGGAFGWHRLTLPQLAAAVARPALTVRGLVPISRIGMHAVAARIVHRLKEEHGLGRSDAIAGTPGFPRAVADVIAELRLARLGQPDLVRAAPELAPLLAAFETELSQAGLTDWAGLLETAAGAVGGSRPHRLVGLPTLLLDISLSSEAELDFVGSLAAKAPELLATAHAADQTSVRRIWRGLHAEIEREP
jgi:ATP-dependent helicase/nuclease subunit B